MTGVYQNTRTTRRLTTRAAEYTQRDHHATGATRVEAPGRYDSAVGQILDLHDVFEAPPGHKVEVIGGTLVVGPSPPAHQQLVHASVRAQLDRLLPTHLTVTSSVTLDMRATTERYVPDLAAMKGSALDSGGGLLDTDQAELVAEIVSPSNSGHDRVTKVRGYAASGVPIYLLVDPLDASVTLFYEPAGGAYQQVHRVPFGASIELPAPYSGKIDTSAFA
jgi:Uma2 family endonuclease